jgi:3-hydroxymyristoyl/3-hydroxydecanoyl-(acyl carrier protein) dehydratase
MRIVGEYDVPAEAWYFRDNAHPSQLPYAVLMEIALQPCGFISAYSGALFHYPNLDLHYRNLDGNGTLLADPDLRDKTIVSEITLKSTVASGNTIIQTHDFALFTDGEKFYSGDTVFGYFTDEALTNQVGLDGGKLVPAWLESVGAGDAHEQTVICWNLAESSEPCFQAPEGRPHQRLATRQLNLLDELRIVPDGGSSGKGYVYGLRTIDPEDWFFPCHFHQDPVMPGSLGVEAILQAMQGFALQQGLVERFQNPRFGWVQKRTAWKYRGQIIRETKRMQLEAHVTDVQEHLDQTVITANASLWRDDLRIYEVTDLRLALREAAA